MISRIGRIARNHFDSIQGIRLQGRYVVLESDDWGSLRMPSRAVFNGLPQSAVGKNPFNYYDTIESSDDLEVLYETLRKFIDRNGNSPVLTANYVVGNPDFQKIKTDQYLKYHWESIDKTYQRYFSSSDILSVVNQGIAEKLIFPQFHGREHLNAFTWLTLLRKGDKILRDAFQKEVFCVNVEVTSLRRNNLMASFDYDDAPSKQFLESHLREGAAEFQRLFGFRSRSFIAPCNVWDSYAEEILSSEAMQYIQSLRVQQIPVAGKPDYVRKRNAIGTFNRFEQLYMVRNVYFEPSTNQRYDWVGNALDKIEAAFFWNKPAIISTHRINYVGGLDEVNRARGVNLLAMLLKKIIKRWPDVEFINSVQLGDKLKNI